MIASIIHSIAKSLALKFCPDVWRKLTLWKSERAERPFWLERSKLLQLCPDNSRINRVPDAGKIIDGLQIMHNGIKVLANSYYGKGGGSLLSSNGGCHEPQEEAVFDAVVNSLPAGSMMIELGAYWGFYSLWFSKVVPSSKVFLVEPMMENLQMGRKNFEINRMSADFTRAFVGREQSFGADGVEIISVDGYVAKKDLKHIAILHSDIQGYELEMLEGAKGLLSTKGVDYVFISTHSMELHYKCRDFLDQFGYKILVSVDTDQTYSFDGILVACSPETQPPNFMHPSIKGESSKPAL